MTTTSVAGVNPLGIFIGGDASKPYKSIGDLSWLDIPCFAVLTGLNGSGKTQLLELLAYRLTDTDHPSLGDYIRQVKVTVTGDNFGPADVAWSPSLTNFSGATALSLANRTRTCPLEVTIAPTLGEPEP
jgi:hypothetical protein